MWTIILLICLLSKDSLPPKIVILDDCRKWKFMPFSRRPEEPNFSLNNEHFEYHNFVDLIHTYLVLDPPEGQLSKIKMTFPEILQQDPLYSSDLSFEDWKELEDQYGKIYILRPNEYCSGQRFEFNHTFTLYEVRFRFPVYE